MCSVLLGCTVSNTEPADRSADAIAQNLEEAAQKTKAGGEDDALDAVCIALDRFSSEPTQSLTKYLEQQAKREEVSARLVLADFDPQAPGLLTDAADEINTVQEATDVSASLGCQ